MVASVNSTSGFFPLLSTCWNWLDQKLASGKLYYLHIHLFLTNKQSSRHIELTCFLYFLNAQLFTLHNRSAIVIKTLSHCCPSGLSAIPLSNIKLIQGLSSVLFLHWEFLSCPSHCTSALGLKEALAYI